FLVVFYFNFAIYREIDQLTNRHSFVNTYRLFNRYFQCPVTAKPNITLTGCSMYINTQTTGGRFTFQERYMGMGFCVFKRCAEVKNMRVQYKPLIRDFKVFYFIMLFGIQYMLAISGQPFSKV